MYYLVENCNLYCFLDIYYLLKRYFLYLLKLLFKILSRLSFKLKKNFFFIFFVIYIIDIEEVLRINIVKYILEF